MILVMSKTNGIEAVEVFRVRVEGSSLVYYVKDYYPGQPVIVNMQEKKEVYIMTPEGTTWLKREEGQ